MEYLIDGCLVEREMSEETKTCYHKMVQKTIQGAPRWCCEKCWHVAHETWVPAKSTEGRG